MQHDFVNLVQDFFSIFTQYLVDSRIWRLPGVFFLWSYSGNPMKSIFHIWKIIQKRSEQIHESRQDPISCSINHNVNGNYHVEFEICIACVGTMLRRMHFLWRFKSYVFLDSLCLELDPALTCSIDFILETLLWVKAMSYLLLSIPTYCHHIADA